MQYFFKLHDGSRYEIDILDYNHLQSRISNGRHKGYYQVRGEINSQMRVNMEYFVCLEKEGTERKDITIRNIDVEKRTPPKVGTVEPKKTGCGHSWTKPETYNFVVANIGGKMQYRKQCPKCNKRSMLVKPLEVKNAMADRGKTLEDVAIMQ